ncbi:MAG: amidase [Alphaproteobacteria bacterium]|nr:amidase [Alphaproteobacteria bacterium]
MDAVMTDIAFLSACDLARLYRSKKLSPVEVTETLLARIGRTQPKLNSYITVDAAGARAGAQAAERRFRDGAALGPLDGVPYSVKDLTNTAGLRTTMGSLVMKDYVPADDAVPVARMRAAGAVLLGKTTTPEWGHKAMTDSPLFGVTPNPWDLTRTSGGSSGGAGAAVAAGLGPIALGTDGGGSIRIPAAVNGIVGLKQTLGRIPNVHAADLFANHSYIGPMTRTAADCALMFAAVAGPDDRDPYGARPPRPVAPLPPGTLAGLRIGLAMTMGNPCVTADVEAAVNASVDALVAMGARVEVLTIDLAQHVDVFQVIWESSLRSRLKELVEKSNQPIADSLRQHIDGGARHNAVALAKAQQLRTSLYRQIEALFAKVDVIASPVTARDAMPLDHDPLGPIEIDGRKFGPMRRDLYPYTWTFNLTGHPAISVPCGFSPAGLPLGLQLVAPWDHDERLLDLAMRLEAVRPWAAKRPPVFAS